MKRTLGLLLLAIFLTTLAASLITPNTMHTPPPGTAIRLTARLSVEKRPMCQAMAGAVPSHAASETRIVRRQ